MLLPPGATLEVQLIADDSTHAPSPVAHSSFGDLHGPPYDFALPYAPADIKQGAHYSLRATLRDAQGHLEFVTPKSVPVTPGSNAIVEFRMVRATTDQD
ncbi:hypothetical protein GCM10009105_08670 [Dokdonella soli]|uniref:Lipoprotein n=2 Tax=Dokdonella soli TaxID=529810 RepID=A0ABN1IED2_9GAMM